MYTVVILLGFVVAGLLLHRLIKKQREAPPVPMTGWNLLRSLVIPLVAGLVLTVITLSALIRGEVACYSKGGGCSAPTVLRLDQPGEYWAGVAHFGFIAALLLWFAWRGFRQWRAENA